MLTDLFGKKGSKADPAADADLVSGLISDLSDGKTVAAASQKADDETAKKKKAQEESDAKAAAIAQAQKEADIAKAKGLQGQAEAENDGLLSEVMGASQGQAAQANAQQQAVAEQAAQGVLQELLNKKKRGSR